VGLPLVLRRRDLRPFPSACHPGDHSSVTDAWIDIDRGVHATNPSVHERELIELLKRHGTDEGVILAEYESMTDSIESPAVRYLVDFIMDDERRHHRIVQELAATLAWSGLDPDRAVPNVPDLGTHRRVPAEFLEQTRRLLEFERADRSELRRLRKKLGDFEDTTIWTLLVDTMTSDTDKHIAILQFLLHHLRS
jgi:hypothetical protein